MLLGGHRIALVGAVFALATVTLVVFAPVRRATFVDYDDLEYVVENPHVATGLTWDNVAWAFHHPYDNTGGPLTSISQMLDVEIAGLSAPYHHLTSLVLHVVNSVLLLLLLYRLTGVIGRSAFVAALFALHPLHVESVAWIAERKDVLSTTFWFATMLAYVAYTRRPGFVRYLAVAIMLALGLMSKPMLVTVPVVLFLMDWWPLGRLSDVSLGSPRFWMLVREKLPLLALALIAITLTFFSQVETGSVSGALSVGARLNNAVVSLVAYLGQMLWPTRLAAFYPFREAVPALTAIACGGLVVAISTFVFITRKRHPGALVGWLWYLVTLTPVIGIVQVGSHAMADRFTYVPLIGVFVAVAWTGAELLRSRGARFLGGAVAASLVLACAVQARQQVEVWHDSATLWQHALRVTPGNYVAHANLGAVFARQGRTADAIAHYTESLRFQPNQPKAENNLGLALSSLGSVVDAVPHYENAIRLDPNYAHAHQNLGVALADLGRFEQAVEHCRTAIRLEPAYAEAHMLLAMVLGSLGRTDEAIERAREALRLRPAAADWHYTTALLFLDKGSRADAILHLEAALRADPGLKEAQQALAALRK
ncbi:MAG TPA: tetratricopeptide repeat protein [Vicinamibacterales bacterium]|nr:tetratricopeptide repeat protein [Vicinamibacterales bacterium]